MDGKFARSFTKFISSQPHKKAKAMPNSTYIFKVVSLESGCVLRKWIELTLLTHFQPWKMRKNNDQMCVFCLSIAICLPDHSDKWWCVAFNYESDKIWWANVRFELNSLRKRARRLDARVCLVGFFFAVYFFLSVKYHIDWHRCYESIHSTKAFKWTQTFLIIVNYTTDDGS